MAKQTMERHRRRAWPRALALLALVAAAFAPAGAERSNNETTCRNAKELGMLECLHGGELYSALNTSRVSCSRCVCPDEAKWGGIDCSLCKSVDSCPANAEGTEATGCTWGGALAPTREELEQPRGKVLSCSCGGDEQSEQYCAMQPFTFALINMKSTEKNGTERTFLTTDEIAEKLPTEDLPNFELEIVQYAGAPDVPGNERYKYAYPVVFNATLTGCEHTVGPCYGPLKAKECDLIKCANGAVSCPPPQVQKCPGWDPIGDCGPLPDPNPSELNYWQVSPQSSPLSLSLRPRPPKH